jgi:plasmid maintenance system antidote protein VapI
MQFQIDLIAEGEARIEAKPFEIALLLEVSPRDLRRIRNGEKALPLDALDKMARKLGTTGAALWLGLSLADDQLTREKADPSRPTAVLMLKTAAHFGDLDNLDGEDRIKKRYFDAILQGAFKAAK